MRFGLGLGLGRSIRAAAPAAVPLFDPLTLGAGLKVWLPEDPTSKTIATGVSQWSDASGSGNHYTQATGNAQPALVASGINGKSTVSFDGTNDLLVGPDPSTLLDVAGWCVYALCSFDAITTDNGVASYGANDTLIGDNNGLWGIGARSTGPKVIVGQYDGGGQAAGESGDTIVVGTPFVLAVRVDADDFGIRINNGVEVASPKGNGAIFTGVTRIGMAGAAAVFTQLRVVELLVVNRRLTDAEDLALRGRLCALGGLAAPAESDSYFPSTLGALTLALDARQITPVGGKVTAWPDLSAAPFTVDQGTGALQPTYVADAGDGLPCVDFTGATYLNGTGVPFGQGAADYTVAVLAKADTDGYLFGAFGTGLRLAGGTRLGTSFAIHRVFDNAGGDGELPLGSLAAGWHLLFARRATTTEKLRADAGADVTMTAPAGALTLTGFTVGAWLGAGALFDGQVAGVWVWSAYKSGAQLTAFRTWLQSERSITP